MAPTPPNEHGLRNYLLLWPAVFVVTIMLAFVGMAGEGVLHAVGRLLLAL